MSSPTASHTKPFFTTVGKMTIDLTGVDSHTTTWDSSSQYEEDSEIAPSEVSVESTEVRGEAEVSSSLAAKVTIGRLIQEESQKGVCILRICYRSKEVN